MRFGPAFASRFRTSAPAYLLALGLFAQTVTAMTFHVSPQGDDTGTGTQAAPFATLERARDEIRARRADGTLPAGPVTIQIEAGTYRLRGTLELTAADAGSAEAPVVWQAAPGAEVRLTGGVRLTEWRRVEDPAVRARLPEEAREHVLVADLKASGSADFGGVAPGRQRAEVFFDNRYLTLARYPNEGWARIADIPPEAAKKRPVSDPLRPDLNRYEGPFLYEGDRPDRWAGASEVWVHGYWYHDWSDQYHEVLRFDRERREIWPKPPYHSYGYKRNQRFYYLNLLEELDQPGEWYLDRAAGLLYLWPPAPVASAEITFPELADPMISITDAEHVHLRGLILECSRAGGIVVSGGSHNEVAGCTLRNLGGTAVAVRGGTRHTVRSCNVYEVAESGITLAGGDRKTLARGDHLADNCHVHHFARIRKTYHPAIRIDGVGNRIAHCLIHDAPHMGVGYAGNDHVIEFTEFTRVARETGDVGAIYAAMDWSYTGHVFRHNYFHHIHGPGQLGCFTVYPDLPCGGIHLYGNVFLDTDQVFHTNSGRDMLIENNLFIRNRRGINFSAWGDMKKFLPGGNWRMVERLGEIAYDQPPYSTRYPMLARLAEDFAKGEDQVRERSIPKDNIIRRNVSWGESWFVRLRPGHVGLDHVRLEHNLITDPIPFDGSPAADGKSRAYRSDDPEIRDLLAATGNIVSSEPPPFANPASGDYRLLDDERLTAIGFEPIPFDQIGLRLDEHRRTLPVLVFAPAIEPASRRFLDPIAVILRPVAPPRGHACTIRYTTDGSLPTENSPAYEGPLHLRDTATLTARAFVHHDGQITASEPVAATYEAIRLDPDGIFLSDLEEQDLDAYLNCWRKDTNHTGAPIRIHGETYARGILLHPRETPDGGRATVTYHLAGELANAARFTATIGIDDAMHVHNRGSAAFVVELFRNGAWERLFASDILRLGDPPATIDLDIAGAERIRLVTTDAGDGIACDHATWANPLLSR